MVVPPCEEKEEILFRVPTFQPTTEKVPFCCYKEDICHKQPNENSERARAVACFKGL